MKSKEQLVDEIVRVAGIGLMNVIEQGMIYTGWGATDAYSRVKETYAEIKNLVKENVDNLPDADTEVLQALGFTLWEEAKEGEESLLLIPIWAYDLIPDGTEMYDLWDQKVVKGEQDIDMDIRFGCLAYGLKRKLQ